MPAMFKALCFSALLFTLGSHCLLASNDVRPLTSDELQQVKSQIHELGERLRSALETDGIDGLARAYRKEVLSDVHRVRTLRRLWARVPDKNSYRYRGDVSLREETLQAVDLRLRHAWQGNRQEPSPFEFVYNPEKSPDEATKIATPPEALKKWGPALAVVSTTLAVGLTQVDFQAPNTSLRGFPEPLKQMIPYIASAVASVFIQKKFDRKKNSEAHARKSFDDKFRSIWGDLVTPFAALGAGSLAVASGLGSSASHFPSFSVLTCLTSAVLFLISYRATEWALNFTQEKEGPLAVPRASMIDLISRVSLEISRSLYLTAPFLWSTVGWMGQVAYAGGISAVLWLKWALADRIYDETTFALSVGRPSSVLVLKDACLGAIASLSRRLVGRPYRDP